MLQVHDTTIAMAGGRLETTHTTLLGTNNWSCLFGLPRTKEKQLASSGSNTFGLFPSLRLATVAEQVLDLFVHAPISFRKEDATVLRTQRSTTPEALFPSNWSAVEKTLRNITPLLF